MAGTYATDLIHLWTTANATGLAGASSNIVEMNGYTSGGGNNRINGDGDLYLSGGSSLTTNGATVPVFVAIVATGYEIIYQDSSLISTDRDIPISQAIDRTYSNP